MIGLVNLQRYVVICVFPGRVTIKRGVQLACEPSQRYVVICDIPGRLNIKRGVQLACESSQSILTSSQSSLMFISHIKMSVVRIELRQDKKQFALSV